MALEKKTADGSLEFLVSDWAQNISLNSPSIAALNTFHKQTERIADLQKQAALTPGETVELTLLLKNKWNIAND